MAVIKVMDDILANKIAAGEVVERVVSIVKELIENSIDANSDEIIIELKESGLREIKITDNGIGMKAESLNHIFDKFYQEDKSHSSNGNGLGLPLVKRIVDLCDGTIRVKSLLGEGSSFTVELPKNNIKIEG